MRYWKYSPGRGAKYWDYCRKYNCAAIGWSDAGDISQLSSYLALAGAFEREGWSNLKWNTGDTQLWGFFNKCNNGDCIVSYGYGYILGIGIVESDYYYDLKNPIDQDTYTVYAHRRVVKWKTKTRKDISNDSVLYGNPPQNYGILNKQLTFYEITSSYAIKFINTL